jgi:glycosyltransferase involved in cell wall biosynthesis
MSAAAKKIAFLSLNRFNPVLCDGVSNSMLELLLFLKRQGHDVSISTVYTQEEYRQFVFRYLAARRRENGNVPASDVYLADLKGVEVWQALAPVDEGEVQGEPRRVQGPLIRRLQEVHPDVVFTVEDDVLSLFAVSILGLPGAHFFHSLAYARAFRNRPVWLSLLKKRRVFTVSAFLGERIKDLLGLQAEVWPPLFDLGSYTLDRKLGEKKVIGYYSAGPHKGDVVVNRLIMKRPDWKFLVVGRNYTALFKEWPSHLIYRGDLTDFREFYGRISVLLVPSLVEDAFPRVILEAAVNGIPVVANRVGGIPEALGEGGLLVDVDLSRADEAGMLDALADEYQTRIDRLLSDREFYALLGRRALARAQAYQENQAQISRRHCAELLGLFSDQRTL